MRLHRFYVNTPISGKVFDISDRDLVHQWKSVFRYNVGSQVILFDGIGVDYLVMITSLRNLGATVEIPFKSTKGTKSKFGLDYSYRSTNPFNGVHCFGARIDL